MGDRDYGLEAQQAAEVRLEECYEHMDCEDRECEIAGMFCGCNTCVVREVLTEAWPILLEAAKAEAG